MDFLPKTTQESLTQNRGVTERRCEQAYLVSWVWVSIVANQKIYGIDTCMILPSNRFVEAAAFFFLLLHGQKKWIRVLEFLVKLIHGRGQALYNLEVSNGFWLLDKNEKGMRKPSKYKCICLMRNCCSGVIQLNQHSNCQRACIMEDTGRLIQNALENFHLLPKEQLELPIVIQEPISASINLTKNFKMKPIEIAN